MLRVLRPLSLAVTHVNQLSRLRAPSLLSNNSSNSVMLNFDALPKLSACHGSAQPPHCIDFIPSRRRLNVTKTSATQLFSL